MAILRGVIRKMRGSVDEMTFRELKGQTTVSAKVGPNNSKTFPQMARRVRWANIVNFWRAMSNLDRPSFESKPRTWSDFNAFMSANIDGTPVYLTAEEARQGAVVVAAYQITRGSLPSIAMNAGTGDVPVSNIRLGNLVIDQDTTLKQFSLAVINNNPQFLNGDQISCFIFTQAQNSVTGVPYADFQAYEVTLNTMDEETLLSDLVPANGFTTVDAKLGCSSAVVGGVCYVQSRKSANRILVSSQTLFVNNSLLAQYQTAAKRTEAIASYGGKTSALFLAPNTNIVQS